MSNNFLPAKPKGGIAHTLSRPRVISKKITSFNGIAEFIQGPLIPLLRYNAAACEILMERDLQGWILTHLSTVIDRKLFLVNNDKTLSGLYNGSSTKSKKEPFTMPDQVIRDGLSRIGIIIEMKSDRPWENGAYLRRKNSRDEFNKDFTKAKIYLENPKLKKHLRYVFFIYICRDPYLSEIEIKNEILKRIHHKYHKRIIPIVINRYWDAKNDRLYSQRKMDQISAKFKDLDKIYVGSKNEKPVAKKDYSRNPKKAVATMQWYLRHPKNPKSIKWARDHPNDSYGYSRRIL